MGTLDDRITGFEERFRLDAELFFRLNARRIVYSANGLPMFSGCREAKRTLTAKSVMSADL